MAKEYYIPISLVVALGSFMMGLIIGSSDYRSYPKQPTEVKDQLHRYRIFMIQCAYYKDANTEIWKKCDEMYQTIIE